LYALNQDERIQLKSILQSIARARGEADSIDRTALQIEYHEVEGNDDGENE
jgi:hypothetical protein